MVGGDTIMNTLELEKLVEEQTKAITKGKESLAYDYNTRSQTMGDFGRFEEALTDLDSAIELNPNDPISYFSRARLNLDLGRYEEAITDLDRAIELNPKCVAAYSSKGLALEGLGNNGAAITSYRLALERGADETFETYHRPLVRAEERLRALGEEVQTPYTARATAEGLVKQDLSDL